MDESVSRRMRNTPTRDTPAEMAIRRILHAHGLRYRVDSRPIPSLRRRADLVFTKSKIAVFVDGCFWHDCPEHGSKPKTNSDWWRDKLAGNVRRDRDTTRQLVDAGWAVIRVWEHETAEAAAERIERAVKNERGVT